MKKFILRSNPLRHCGVMGFDSKRNTQNTEVFLTFRLSVRASHLWTAPYSEYQQFLYDTISEFRQIEWNYTQIANWLNENNYKTPRGKKFQGSHAHSIVKKKIRESRSTQRYSPRLSNFGIRFVDRTLINTLTDEETA